MHPPTQAADGRPTLAQHIARQDGAAFVGRAAELRVVDALFADDAGPSVLLVWGPEGIGKSALLREAARRGRRAGWAPFAGLDAGAWRTPRPLVLLDGGDWPPAAVRGRLATLPERAVVVLAARERPDEAWFEDGWEALCTSLFLRPLAMAEALQLLARRGLRGDPRGPAIARRAAGVPLALRLAADAARADPAWRPVASDAPSGCDDVPTAVRDALRSLRLPHVLARSPLATGDGVPARAESVRALILAAVEDAFGDTHDERLLRRVLVRGYLDPAASQERAAVELHLSRSSYFRRLRIASERVADLVAASDLAGSQRTG
jgi:hypothetical protein